MSAVPPLVAAAPAGVAPRSQRRFAVPLSWSLPAGIAVVLLVMMALTMFISAERGERLLFDRAELELRQDAARLARLAARDLATRPGDLLAELAPAARDRRLAGAAVVDAQGRVRIGLPAAWAGRPAAEVAPDWAAAWPRLQAGQRWLQRDDTGLVIGWWQPVPLQSGPGAVYVRYDLRNERRGMVDRLLANRSVDIVAALAVALLLAGLLHRWVARPLRRLQAATRALADGHTASVPEDGPAELAALARSFNEMAASLASAQEELRASQQRLSMVFYSTGDAMMALDRELRVTLLNPVAEALCGWPESEAKGRQVSEVFRIENAQSGRPAEFPIERVVREGVVIGLANHTQLVARDGRRTHIADSAAPIRAAGGRLEGAIVVFRDVTEQYRLQEALARSEWYYRTLADSGNAMIWSIDEHGGSAWGNRNWLQFCGRTQEKLGEDWVSLLHPDDRETHFQAWSRALAKRAPVQLVVRYRRHDGVYRWIMHDGAPRFDIDGRFMGYIGHGLDITELHAAQRRLAEQLEELQRWHAAMVDRESRVIELKAEVNTLAAELGRSPPYASGAAPRGDGASGEPRT